MISDADASRSEESEDDWLLKPVGLRDTDPVSAALFWLIRWCVLLLMSLVSRLPISCRSIIHELKEAEWV